MGWGTQPITWAVKQARQLRQSPKRWCRSRRTRLSQLKSLLIFEYRDEQGIWFGLNPILAQATQLIDW